MNKRLIKKIRIIMFAAFIIACLNITIKVSAEVREPRNTEQSNTVTITQVPNTVIEVLKNIQKYSQATQEEKQIICEYFKIRDEVLAEVNEKGHNLTDSINMAILISKYNLSVEDMEKMLNNHQDIKNAAIELCKLEGVMIKNKFSQDKTLNYRRLLVEGYKIEEINSAYKITDALGLELDKAIRKDGDIDFQSKIESLNKQYGKKEVAIIKSICKEYFIDIDYLLSYLDNSEASIEEDYDKIIKYEIEVAKLENREIKIETRSKGDTEAVQDKTTDGTKITSGDDTLQYNRYFNSPFNYKRNNNESISPINGGLTYESQDLYLPGKNGLDVNIATRYESSKSNLFRPVARYSLSYIYEYVYNFEVYGEGMGMYFACGFYNIDDFYNNSNNHAWEVGPLRALEFDVLFHYIGTYSNENDAFAVASNYAGVTTELLFEDPNNLEKGYKIVHYSALVDPIVVGIIEIPIYTYNEDAEDDTSYGLGTGWSFGFSCIELIGEERYLHLANGQAYKINMTSYPNDSNLDKYTLEDIKLEYDYGSFNNGEAGSSYVLMYKDGKKEYFADDGRLLAIKDRYDNTITFYHTHVDGFPVITRIVDTLGRETNIHYNTTYDGREVVIVPPNRKVIRYRQNLVPGYVNEYMLREKIDAKGNSTLFDYSIDQGNFSLLDKTYRATPNYYANLRRITYPTNAMSSYSYEMATGNMGNLGSMEYYKVKTREDNVQGYICNEETYNYIGDYTGYMYCDDPEFLPDNFTFKTNVVDNSGLTIEPLKPLN